MSEWKEELPEALHDAPWFKEADSLETAVSQMKDAAAHVGNSLRIPGPNSDDEQLATFLERAVEKIPGLMRVPDEEHLGELFTKIGKPEEAAGYKLPELEDVQYSQEEVDAMRSWAHENNMTQAQFEKFITLNHDRVVEAAKAHKEQLEQEGLKLTNAWGQDTDRRLKAIEHWLGEDAPPEMLKQVQEGTLSSTMAQWLYGIVEKTAEGGNINMAGDPAPVMTPGEAKAELAELTEAIFKLDVGDPRRDELNKKRIEAAQVIADADADAQQQAIEARRQVR